MKKSKKVGASIRFAEKLFGNDMFDLESSGMYSVRKIEPNLPFSERELERAHDLDMQLFYDVSTIGLDFPATMRIIMSVHDNRFGQSKILRGGEISFSDPNWFKRDDFFTTQILTTGWKLVGKEVIPGCMGKNYIDQTAAVADFLTGSFYRKIKMPKVFGAAIKEFETRRDEIKKLIIDAKKENSPDYRRCAMTLSGLRINRLFRETPVEVMVHLMIDHKINRRHLLRGGRCWTGTLSDQDYLVNVSYYEKEGMLVDHGNPHVGAYNCGVRLCIRGSDLNN